MKVCAHAYVACQSHYHYRADSIRAAVEQFRTDIEDLYRGPEVGGERGGVDLYPQCDDCDWNECHHDYPMQRWEIGIRGGLRKVHV